MSRLALGELWFPQRNKRQFILGHSQSDPSLLHESCQLKALEMMPRVFRGVRKSLQHRKRYSPESHHLSKVGPFHFSGPVLSWGDVN